MQPIEQSVIPTNGFPKYFRNAFCPNRVNTTVGIPSQQIRLSPFPVDSAMNRRGNTIKYKATYSVVDDPRFPGLWSLDFRTAIYKVLRGTGGTASTLVKVLGSDNIETAGGVVGSPLTGTFYGYPTASSSSVSYTHLTDGIYVVAFKYENLSPTNPIITFNLYGNAMTGSSGYFYYSDGNQAGALPLTIAAFSVAATFVPYFELL